MFLTIFAMTTATAGEIQVNTKTPVMVVVDGQILEYPDGSTAVTAIDLAGGSHTVEIKNIFGKPITSTTVDLPVDQQVRLEYGKKELRVLGSGTIAPKPTTTIVVQSDSTPAPAPLPGAHIVIDDGTDKVEIHASMGVTTTSITETTTTTAAKGVPTPMGAAPFASLRQQLADADFSSDRIELVQTAAARNWFTCQQIARLLETFEFDNNRVDGAKILAPRAIDPNNAHVVAPVFEFSSNKNEALALFQ